MVDKYTGRLSGKVAIITGGTSGIGEATVELFTREGATVVFTGRRTGEGKKVESEIITSGGKVLFIEADHTKEADCKKVVDQTVKKFGQIDILFNNAGIVTQGRAEDTSEQEWSRAFEINVQAVWRMCKLVIPHMRKQGGGVIVNNASDWGVVGGKNAVLYCATKGAVVQMTRAMALDHGKENIRINAVCPGDTIVDRWIEKEYYKGSGPVTREEALKDGEVFPLGRVGMPEEIAKAVLFLASDDSSYMTGSILLVDGGNTAG
jgi:NAD(P)-dependent dehydrogenase (short-subunit alcohol dehydrogenase family)